MWPIHKLVRCRHGEWGKLPRFTRCIYSPDKQPQRPHKLIKIDNNMKWRTVKHIQDFKRAEGHKSWPLWHWFHRVVDPVLLVKWGKKSQEKQTKSIFAIWTNKKMLTWTCCLTLKLSLVEILYQLYETVETSWRKQACACARTYKLISVKYTIKGREKKNTYLQWANLESLFSPSVHMRGQKLHLENRCCSRISLLTQRATSDPSLFH